MAGRCDRNWRAVGKQREQLAVQAARVEALTKAAGEQDAGSE
jgi:hypothetical protein